MKTMNNNPTDQTAEDATRLEALRRDAAIGTEAYKNGDFTVINSDAALDCFFEDLARA